MEQKHVAIIAGSITVIFAIVFSLQWFGVLDITGNDHRVTVANQNFTLSSGWPQQTTGYCQQSLIDNSNAQSVKLNGASFNDRTICDFGLGATVSLKDLDLSKYQRVRISRSGTLTGTGKDGNGAYSTSVFGHPAAQQQPRGSASTSLGDIFITNSGGVITIKASPESIDGFNVPADESLYFENTISVSGQADVKIDYQITDVQLTPFASASVPAPVLGYAPPPPPRYTSPIAQVAPKEGFFAKIWHWITGWF